jgi:hypothetical protein
LPARSHLSTGKHIDVPADPNQVLEALNSPTGRLVQVPGDADTPVLLNPDHVAYVEEKPSGRVSFG